MSTSPSAPETQKMPTISLGWRLAGWLALAVVILVGFAGYFMPGLRLNWETIAAMCGF